MNYDLYKPIQELSTIVRQYVVINDIKDIETMLFLPRGGNFLTFNRGIIGSTRLHTGKSFEIAQEYTIGMKTSKAKKTILDPKLDMLNVEFPIILIELMPIGYYKLFKKDASLLTMGHIKMDKETVAKYFSKLYTHNSTDEEISYLNNSLKEMSLTHKNTHLIVEDIIDSIIHKHQFEVTVEELMLEFGYTRKTMERQFKKIIGLTPKNFIYLLKFCKTFLEYIQETKRLNKIEYFYNDSAHFNVVFKNITGYTPSELFNDVVKKKKLKIYQMKQFD